MRLFAAAALLIMLTACGLREPLRPADGQALPPAAAHTDHVATPDELLTVPSEFRPLRVDEPLTRSERRPVDPYDLPPTDVGGVGTANNSQSELQDQPAPPAASAPAPAPR